MMCVCMGIYLSADLSTSKRYKGQYPLATILARLCSGAFGAAGLGQVDVLGLRTLLEHG